MFMDHLQESVLKLSSEKEKEKLKAFLNGQGLSMDKDIEYTMVITDSDRIVASGSFSDRVLKCIAVEDEYKGQGLSARIITHLVNEQYARGRTHLFIYTKPENRRIFSELGFYPVAEVRDKVVLMENRSDGIKRYLDEIAGQTGTIVPSAAVVVNCNPFTNGHKYLLEYAAARCGMLHVFVVWEDRSLFPAEVRYRLVREGAAHIPNISVHKGRDYIISNATFPSYFIKQYEDVVEIHAGLDLEIFSQYIAKRLDIRKRFVGEEPYCPVTAAYNRMMGRILPPKGIEVEIVPRMASGGNAISASRVRELLGRGDMDEVKKLVPETTLHFLLSKEGEQIIKKIKAG
ncbi:MAG: [citrate (pro-3S)-lyase] ligase [Smithella sp.]